MFKGYVEMKGKRPIENIKDRTEFWGLEDVQHLKEYGGVLADDIILIDIDESKQAEKLNYILDDMGINCTKIKTDRGMHFYFKNSGVKANVIHKHCALGLIIDIKLGSKNAVVPLKINGALRPMTTTGVIDTIPRWLFAVKGVPNFASIGEGDGRNQTLFNYILTLQKHGFTKFEIRETLTIINKYIMVEKLEDSELNTILRDEAFTEQNFYDENGNWKHNLFAEYLKREYHMIKINNELHYYDNGVYVNNQIGIEKLTIKHIPTLNRAKRTEVISYLNIIADNVQLSPSTHIICNNGLLNIETLELEPFTHDYIAVNKIPVDYNPAAYSEVVDQVLLKTACNDKSLKALLEEMFGYTLFRRPELGRCFILTGKGSNGKSTILDMLKSMLGNHNVSAVALEEIESRFKTADIVGKLANIGDDISNNYMPDNAKFKKLVTGETLLVERKGKDPFEINNFGKLIFSANEIPRVNDTSDGLKRRLIIIPFNARFSSSDVDFDPYIKDKLMTQESLEYLLLLAVQGLKRVLNGFKFTEVESVTRELQEYEKINNPILLFLDEVKVVNEPVQVAYDKYNRWCLAGGMKPFNRTKFVREVNERGYCTKQLRVTKNRPIKGYNEGDRVQIFYIKGE